MVSNKAIAGSHVGALDALHELGCSITRIRRGDIDLIAEDGLALQLGDRVRVVGPTAALGQAAVLLGDSERRLAEVDAFGFAIGTALGLALGMIRVPLPGGAGLELGAGGGPLVVGLILGVRVRSGPVVWQIPQGANLVLRQFGILMFLAAAGLGSGSAFADAISTPHGWELFAAGAVLAGAFAALTPVALELALRRDAMETAGLFSGLETQPAALAYAGRRTDGDERVNLGYALIFPAAMIAKIVAVQFLT
ncbi:MAG: TrkA C-terminal domain-containing protein [Ilumatobacteraceae bacterium]